MESIGMLIAVTGIALSVSLMIYALWQLFGALADYLDARERQRRRQIDF